MTKGRKTGGRDFVPGDPRAGRPPLPPELKAAKRLTKTELETALNKYLFMPVGELKALLENTELATIESVFVSALCEARTTGSLQGIEWMVSRIIGKVKEQVDVNHRPTIIESLDGKRVELGMAKAEGNE